jgi:hypothetical protein
MKLAKMSGGAKMGLASAIVITLLSVFIVMYKGCAKNILLLIGLFFVFFGLTQDISGSLITASVLTVGYTLLSRKSYREGFADAEAEEDEEPKPKAKASKKIPPPDNGDRAEMFQLGKKYKIPGESDDSEFHLDAGTTFMNAYKALKPDQVAAMTKDTQELMETQKQLMSTLQTLKPLITDGKQMMEMFQSYFGTGNPTPN